MINDYNSKFYWPNGFTPGIDKMSARFQKFADNDPFVHFLACPSVSQFLLNGNSAKLDPALLPDGLHPTAPAMEFMAKCLEPVLGQFLGSSGPQQATQG